jgi:hypothetical protein
MKPAFVIGVTGKMKFSGYQSDVSDPGGLSPISSAIRKRFIAVLDWVRHDPSPCEKGGMAKGFLNPVTGCFYPDREAGEQEPWWRALGMVHTPIVLLTSLAPGVDTLVAEAALDYAEETGADLLVRGVLPFPLEIYRDSSTFCPQGEGQNDWLQKQNRLDEVVGRMRQQTGWVEERDLFCVDLHPDLALPPGVDLRDDLIADSPEGRPRRRLRYRAAGDFVATHSDLLIAVFPRMKGKQGDTSDLFASGTEVIVETKREGLTYGLLPGEDGFSWADNGPVLHFPLQNQSGSGGIGLGPLVFLHPYDSKPSGKLNLGWRKRFLIFLKLARVGKKDPVEVPGIIDDQEPVWQAHGDAFFRKILFLQEEFNRSVGRDLREEEECVKAVNREMAQLLDSDTDNRQRLEPSARDYGEQHLEALVQVRCRAKVVAEKLKQKREKLMAHLLFLVFGMALALGVFGSWQLGSLPEGNSLQERVAPVRPSSFLDWRAPPEDYGAALILGFGLALAFFSAWIFHRYLSSDAERRRFDYRALAEGLRVQIYWSLAGVSHCVASHYMQRQRSEMDWIRYVIGALDSPQEYRRKQWAELDQQARASLLERVRQRWVCGQRKYTRGAKLEARGKGAFWNHWGWAFGVAALLNVFLELFARVLPPVDAFLARSGFLLVGWGFLMGLGLCVFAAFFKLLQSRRGKGASLDDPEDHDPKHGFLSWIFSRPLLWGWGMMLGSFLLALSLCFASFQAPVPGFPNRQGLWIICVGGALLVGGLALAWKDRKLYSELTRQNQALENLFTCADRRLERLIAIYNNPQTPSPAVERALREIHSILFQLGREALAENTEWLVLHRTRPLEPFLAG